MKLTNLSNTVIFYKQNNYFSIDEIECYNIAEEIEVASNVDTIVAYRGACNFAISFATQNQQIKNVILIYPINLKYMNRYEVNKGFKIYLVSSNRFNDFNQVLEEIRCFSNTVDIFKELDMSKKLDLNKITHQVITEDKLDNSEEYRNYFCKKRMYDSFKAKDDKIKRLENALNLHKKSLRNWEYIYNNIEKDKLNIYSDEKDL